MVNKHIIVTLFVTAAAAVPQTGAAQKAAVTNSVTIIFLLTISTSFLNVYFLITLMTNPPPEARWIFISEF